MAKANQGTIERLRQSGQTSKQMLDAPAGAVYIWHQPINMEYPRALARTLGRGDLHIISPNDLKIGGTLAGRPLPGLVLDHAADLNPEQRNAYNVLAAQVVSVLPREKMADPESAAAAVSPMPSGHEPDPLWEGVGSPAVPAYGTFRQIMGMQRIVGIQAVPVPMLGDSPNTHAIVIATEDGIYTCNLNGSNLRELVFSRG